MIDFIPPPISAYQVSGGLWRNNTVKVESLAKSPVLTSFSSLSVLSAVNNSHGCHPHCSSIQQMHQIRFPPFQHISRHLSLSEVQKPHRSLVTPCRKRPTISNPKSHIHLTAPDYASLRQAFFTSAGTLSNEIVGRTPNICPVPPRAVRLHPQPTDVIKHEEARIFMRESKNSPTLRRDPSSLSVFAQRERF